MLPSSKGEELGEVEERRTVDEELPQRATQGEDVRGGGDALVHGGDALRGGVAESLRGDVASSSSAGVEEVGVVRGVVGGERRGLEGCEIGEEHPPPAGDEDVLALDVAVGHAALVAVREGVQELVRHPSLLDVAQEGAHGDAVVQGAVRVLAHEIDRALRLELALEGPGVEVARGGRQERLAGASESTLVLADVIRVETAPGRGVAPLQVHLHHNQAPARPLLVAREERLEEAPAPEAVLVHQRRNVRGEQLAGLHPRGGRQLVPHLGLVVAARLALRARAPLKSDKASSARTRATGSLLSFVVERGVSAHVPETRSETTSATARPRVTAGCTGLRGPRRRCWGTVWGWA